MHVPSSHGARLSTIPSQSSSTPSQVSSELSHTRHAPLALQYSPDAHAWSAPTTQLKEGSSAGTMAEQADAHASAMKKPSARAFTASPPPRAS